MNSKSLISPMNKMTVAEGLTLFPAESPRKVQILRPFAAYSVKSYSTPVTAPIGPAYLAAILEKAGYAVGIIDGIGEGIENLRRSECGKYAFQGLTVEEIVARIYPETEVLGISLMFSQDWVPQRQLINAIKTAWPTLTIIVGGEHPTAMPDYVLRDCPNIDYIIAGEGELALLEFLHLHFAGKETSQIPGLFSIGEDGALLNIGPARRISDFANLPWPAWHLCDIEKFFMGMWSMGIGYGRNMLVLATRGCPYQCTFCSNPAMWTTRYMMRPVNDVLDEIQHLIATYGANSIDFADLTAIVKKEWIMEFCAEIKRRGMDFVWQLPSGTRSEALDSETVQAIYDAGCRFLVYAPESGSARTLVKIKKRLKLDRMYVSIRQAVKAGHTIKINFVIGFPHENRRDMLKTLWASMRMAVLGVSDSNIAIFSPYPGSEIFYELQADGTIPELNDTYFHNLLVQFDFTLAHSVCKNVPSWEIAAYRFFGMSSFYVLSYLMRPARLWRLFRNITGKDFHANSLFEQRIFDLLKRSQLSKS